MNKKLKIVAICGSASEDSSNLAILKWLALENKPLLEFNILTDLAAYPHFQTALTTTDTPLEIREFRKLIEAADGVLICTPEYVFSIPSRLKNVLEWCVSTTVFSDKPVGLITASAQGEKAHAELQLVLKTIQAKFTEATTLLIQGVKGKLDDAGEITDSSTKNALLHFTKSLVLLVNNSTNHD